MSKQTEQVLSAFQSGQRVKLGSMSGKAFGKLMNELREFRERQEAA
ncbi:TPA: hypothetical protein HHT09_RS28245 [Escherichia coli]|jgi:hypothetical protein|uniref:Uncharacterized protein n=1 Tax=Edwardsiella piscicida TaxID=1263550 RepID=A0AAU8PSJ4_EDWPI|nr:MULTISPECIES: hypothetical protein [Gammaproteobacteria]ACY86403.1 hypothetical protein ETAE_p020 [Edwardsiella tarda EIB202]HAM8461500.1 hypothetical protein [Escherichia coli]HCE3569217.1 hypothetical protein [Vibrio parahaemolyticus]MDW3058886.1 hypothetical protein [Vibrio sp. 1978]MDW5378823.1 hypothetical protein [Halomonas sp. HP20-15]